MKVLGISGSQRKGQTTDQLVKKILENIDGETEFISLRGKNIRPCSGCLGCTKDNVCKVKDDMAELRDKILEADVLVIGSAGKYGIVDAQTHALLERFYQFRHREAMLLAGKKVILAGVAGFDAGTVIESMKSFFVQSDMEIIGEIKAQGAAGCFTCGYGESCKVGAVYSMLGPDAVITEENTPCLLKQTDVLEKARQLGIQVNNIME